MKWNKNLKILIVGLGFIGGSYALKLSEKGYFVGAISLKQEDIDYALKNNYIKSGSTQVDKDYIKQFDVVIFALYPKVFLSWIKEYNTYFKDGAVIIDVCGIKEKIIYEVEKILPNTVQYISTHPMAGKEVFGVQNADPSVFINANYIITPTENSSYETIEIASSLANELEFSNISLLTPEKHDEMIAFLSQLTHCIAVSLMTCKESTHLKDYTGDSFRDLTRIASINEKMWSELFLLNKDKLLFEMDNFIKALENLKETIENDDVNKMQEMMKLSTYRRSFFNKK